MRRNLRTIAALALVLATLCGALLPVTASAEMKMKVTASWLRLRKGPGTQYDIKNKFRNGTIVTVLTSKTNKYWYYVKTPNGQIGWMYKGYLKNVSSIVPPKKEASGTAVAKRNINHRTGPSKKYDILQVIPAGTSMTILGMTDGWYQVKVGKTVGYVMKKLVTTK